MIRLGALFTDHLNLNGDLGNVSVIQSQFTWRGIDSEIVKIESLSQLSQPIDFLFIGHGSLAAWADIDSELEVMLPQIESLIAAGLPALAISTGFEALAKRALFADLELTQLPERVSKFEVIEDGSHEVLGYLNTDVNLPFITRQANFIGCMLHGPVLAKNPELLDEVLSAICSRAGLALPPIQSKEKADQLAGLIHEVWVLEKELASE